MSFQNIQKHFDKHGYFWHSNPSKPDGLTFFEKGILRPELRRAYQVLANQGEHHIDDVGAAEVELRLHGTYQDSLGKTITNDNPNMMSGRAAQHYCDQVLLEEAAPGDAYAETMNMLHSYQGGYWRDKAQDDAVIAHRTTLRYSPEGKVVKEPTACEFELVCNNALDGVREATAGDNRIVGEVELLGHLPKCALQYKGYPDYQEGKVELKTQWDGKAYSDKPTANSLPSDIKEPHLYQIAGYWHLSGIIPKIVYANRMGYRVFEPTQDQLEFALSRIIEACRRRERLMLAADTTEKLLRLTDPQWSHIFGWRDMNPDLLHRAKKIWSE